MAIAEGILIFLIVIAVIVGLVYLVFWVLAQLGIPVPENVKRVVWVIVLLIVLLLLLRTVWPVIAGVMR